MSLNKFHKRELSLLEGPVNTRLGNARDERLKQVSALAVKRRQLVLEIRNGVARCNRSHEVATRPLLGQTSPHCSLEQI